MIELADQLQGGYMARERIYLRWNEGRKRPASDEAHLDNCTSMSAQLISQSSSVPASSKIEFHTSIECRDECVRGELRSDVLRSP
jgi:hypothetical protein